MNCPNCKNPIQDNSTECEWCGSKILQLNAHNEKFETTKTIKFVFNGKWFLIDSYTEVYLDGILELIGSVKNGFNFEIKNSAHLPTIKLKNFLNSKIIELPPLQLNKNYLVEIEYSRMWGNYCSKPKLIQEI